MLKEGSLLVWMVLMLFLLATASGSVANGDSEKLLESTTVGNSENLFFEQTSETGSETYNLIDASTATVTPATEEQPATATIPEDQTFQVNSVPETYNIQTKEGTVSGFSMTNALFSLGSLVQGSFISFNNNNNIFWKSLFDSSTFVATLDENGELQVAQRNTFGDLGRVYVSLDGGNLTQDDAIIYVPDGNEPMYIYYNTTEIEFKDGIVYLFDESVTNPADDLISTQLTEDQYI